GRGRADPTRGAGRLPHLVHVGCRSIGASWSADQWRREWPLRWLLRRRLRRRRRHRWHRRRWRSLLDGLLPGGLDGGLLELADGLGAALMFRGPSLNQRVRNTGPLVVRPSTFFSMKPRRKCVALFRVANAVSIPTGLVRVIEVLAPVLLQLDDLRWRQRSVFPQRRLFVFVFARLLHPQLRCLEIPPRLRSDAPVKSRHEAGAVKLPYGAVFFPSAVGSVSRIE